LRAATLKDAEDMAKERRDALERVEESIANKHMSARIVEHSAPLK